MRFNATANPPVLLVFDVLELLLQLRILFHPFFDPFSALFGVVSFVFLVVSPDCLTPRTSFRVAEFVQEVLIDTKSSRDRFSL